MNATAEILIAERDNVLTVPIKAVLSYDGKDHVAVKKPDGGFEWRDVTVGGPTTRSSRSSKGSNPASRSPSTLELMSEEERQRFGNPAHQARRSEAQVSRADVRGSPACSTCGDLPGPTCLASPRAYTSSIDDAEVEEDRHGR